jgi:hypothetical protein
LNLATIVDIHFPLDSDGMLTATLAAIHRATITGCALLEASRDEAWTTLQLLCFPLA